MSNFDDRLIKIELIYSAQDGTNQQILLTAEQGLNIRASGTKYADITQNECTVTIGNLKKETRDLLATQLTPFDYSQKRKSMNVYAGRVSTGLALIYSGDIVECSPSQPPDILLTIKCKTMQFFKYDLLAQSYAVDTPLSQIANDVSNSMGLALNFTANDKTIGNYAYTGSVLKQVDKLQAAGGVDAYIDDKKLIVKNKGTPLPNVSHILSQSAGMVGIPELTEYGVKCKALFTPAVSLGGTLSLQSIINKSLNGDYTIYKLGFDVCSRDTPFYTIIEATRYPAIFFNGILPV